MALPKTVRLDSADYSITAVSQNELDRIAVSIAPPGALAGCISYRTHDILLVTKDTSPSRVARNLLHEAIHGLIVDSKIPKDLNEEVTLFLESRLSSFIKDNPKVIKYLQETL
jgi:hypothetical protein